MRFGGFTDGVRRGNGFTEGVMFLGVQQDLLLFLQYYDFQKEALARGDDWMEGEYPQRFKPVVNSARKHAKKSLRLDEHLAMTTVNAGQSGMGPFHKTSHLLMPALANMSICKSSEAMVAFW